MSRFLPYFTNDGSVGLYNEDFEDIYHSATGAVTESFEKFVLPIDFSLYDEHIKILDICYGIGYNTKALLTDLFYPEIFQKIICNYKIDIASIYTNNTLTKEKLLLYNDKIYSNKNSTIERELSVYNDKIHDNNTISSLLQNLSSGNEHKFENDTKKQFNIKSNSEQNIYNIRKVSITAIDTDRTLALLSPLIRTGETNIINQKFLFENSIVKKYLNNDNIFNIEIPFEINLLLLFKIIAEKLQIYNDIEVKNIIDTDKYSDYFDEGIKSILNSLSDNPSSFYNNSYKNSNLHNIYYSYISNNNKTGVKHPIFNNVNFNLKIDDARKVLQDDNQVYDIIFLDAFTPSKCPCLWSVDFFRLLFNHLPNNGIILTYSSAANIRNAFLEAGFFIGNNYYPSLKKFGGTIASKNKDLIKFKIPDFEMGFLKTKAGIVYKDPNLNSENSVILENQKFDKDQSNLISSSKYRKLQKHILEN